MTDVAIVATELESSAAGDFLGRAILDQIGGKPDAVIVFAAPNNDYPALLTALRDACSPGELIGCSSAGEFTSSGAGNSMTCVFALRSPEMRFKAGVGRDLNANRGDAADAIVSGFQGISSPDYRFRTALVLVDALAGYAEEFVDRLTTATAGTYRFFGGGAGDDARFQTTHVFYGTEAYTNAAVALEILSNKPIGIGARHGWQPASAPFRVTESNEASLVSLNVAPAVEAFEEHAETTSQAFDRNDPMPFFLHNIVGVKTEGGHKLRVPLGVSDAGAIACAAEVPTGATACIMTTGSADAAEAAATATADAMEQISSAGCTPKAALFFDCVATRLRLGKDFDDELDAVDKSLGGIPLAGFNSYGQIVRADGQFSGFHNCTAVVAIFPD